MYVKLKNLLSELPDAYEKKKTQKTNKQREREKIREWPKI